MTQYPHCDSDVLHAPGVCEFCDRHPDWQAARVAGGINFTGEHLPGRILCPAERNRSIDTIERWGGNVPETPQRKVERDAYWNDVDEKLRAMGYPVEPYLVIDADPPSRVRRVLRFLGGLFR